MRNVRRLVFAAVALVVVAAGATVFLMNRQPDRDSYVISNNRILGSLPFPAGAREAYRQVLADYNSSASKSNGRWATRQMSRMPFHAG